MWRQSSHDRTAGGGRYVKVRTSNASGTLGNSPHRFGYRTHSQDYWPPPAHWQVSSAGGRPRRIHLEAPRGSSPPPPLLGCIGRPRGLSAVLRVRRPSTALFIATRTSRLLYGRSQGRSIEEFLSQTASGETGRGRDAEGRLRGVCHGTV